MITTTYISLLRGINVGGRNIIKMNFLRKMYEELGLIDVKSYVQSGNLIFSGKDELNELWEQVIAQKIKKKTELSIPVFILKVDELKSIIENNPFIKDFDKNILFMHIIFLSSKPECYDFKEITNKKQIEEEIHITDYAIYLYCPNGYAQTKLTNNFLEEKLKVNTTTRNWKTSNELLRLAEQCSN